MALPVAIRCGLAWVVPEAAADFDWGAWFGPLGDELEALGYDGRAASPHERRFVQPSNWKLVLDANLESYHFQYAHRATIAHLFHDNVVQQQSFGRHQRIVLPKRSLAEVAASEGDVDVGWHTLGRHSNIIYFFFPSTFVLWEGDHANAFNVTPETGASCATASWMIVPAAQHARRDAVHWQRNWTIFWDAIDEDFALAASMQSGLASGANAALTFGSNEFACDLFEREVDALVGAEALAARLSSRLSSPAPFFVAVFLAGVFLAVDFFADFFAALALFLAGGLLRRALLAPAPCRLPCAPPTGRWRSPACDSSRSCRSHRSSACRRFFPSLRPRPCRRPSCHTLPWCVSSSRG